MNVIRAGRGAAALAALAAIVFGAGMARAASSTGQPARAVMILLDVNQSFPAAAAAAEQSAAVAYLNALPSDVRAGLITFNESWTVLIHPTRRRQPVAAAITSAQRSGLASTGLAGALAAARSATLALGPTAQVRVVVLSDAEDLTGPAPTSSLPADVVTWRFESDDDQRLLLRLAAHTGGRAAGPAAAAALGAAFPAVTPSPAASQPAATGSPSAAATVPLPPSAAWRFSTPLLGSVAALLVAFAVIVMVASGVSISGRRGRRLAGQLGQYGPGHTASKPTEAESQSKVAGAAVGLAERALQARGADRTLAERLDLAGLTIKPAEFLVLGACVSFVLAAGLTILAGTFFIGVPAGLVAGWLAMRLLLSVRIGRRRSAFGDQLPDVLQLVASSLQSGFSLAQAIDAVVREGSQPSAGEFARALGEARIGADLADALDGVATRMDSPDMRWSVMAIRIQRSVGGNLAEVLRNTIATMRERAFLRRHVKSLSAEGRLSAYILVALPLLLGGWLFYSSRSYMRLLYTTPLGLTMFCGAAVLVVVGAFWMRALIKVEV
ncbi:MAG TPA: type II secretion system F family protein [Streptosporangiaceae bacterium]|nr:type II secretion system F family protein [Streptosporangiaceae bacterium]